MGDRRVSLVPSQKASKRVDVKSGVNAILDGYVFVNDKSQRLASNGEMRHYWHCEEKSCKSRLITDDSDLVISVTNHVDHDPPRRKVGFNLYQF